MKIEWHTRYPDDIPQEEDTYLVVKKCSYANEIRTYDFCIDAGREEEIHYWDPVNEYDGKLGDEDALAWAEPIEPPDLD